MGTANAVVVDRAMHGDHDAFAALIGLATNRLYAMACLILQMPNNYLPIFQR